MCVEEEEEEVCCSAQLTAREDASEGGGSWGRCVFLAPAFFCRYTTPSPVVTTLPSR